MANFRSLPFSILSLLLLASLIMAAGSDGGGGEEELVDCLSLDPCRAGVSNDQCCKAIEKGIGTKGCNCVCTQLAKYKAPALTTSCTKCAKCKLCKCGTNLPLLRGTVG